MEKILIAVCFIFVLLLGLQFPAEEIAIQNEQEEPKPIVERISVEEPENHLDLLNALCNANEIPHLSSYEIKESKVYYNFEISEKDKEAFKECFKYVSKEMHRFWEDKDIEVFLYSKETLDKCLIIFKNGKIEMEF